MYYATLSVWRETRSNNAVSVACQVCPSSLGRQSFYLPSEDLRCSRSCCVRTRWALKDRLPRKVLQSCWAACDANRTSTQSVPRIRTRPRFDITSRRYQPAQAQSRSPWRESSVQAGSQSSTVAGGSLSAQKLIKVSYWTKPQRFPSGQ